MVWLVGILGVLILAALVALILVVDLGLTRVRDQLFHIRQGLIGMEDGEGYLVRLESLIASEIRRRNPTKTWDDR